MGNQRQPGYLRFDYGAQTFVNVPGKLTSIAVGGPSFGTSVWGINAANNVFAFNGTAFVLVPGQLAQIGVFGGAVWGINSNQDIFRFEF